MLRGGLRRPSARVTATRSVCAQWLSSGTSDGRRFISGEGPDFDRRSRLPEMHDDLVAAAVSAERNAAMVLGLCDHAVSGSAVVLRDPIGAVKDLHAARVFADPDILAGVLPRHRITTTLPCHVGIARHAARLIFGNRVWRSVTDRLKRAALRCPPSYRLLVCSPVDALIGDCPYPLLHLCVEI